MTTPAAGTGNGPRFFYARTMQICMFLIKCTYIEHTPPPATEKKRETGRHNATRKGSESMANINTSVIDAVISPEIIAGFVSACFPDAPRIPRAEAWKRFQDYYAYKYYTPSKSAFFYAMRRDGWTDQRTKQTNYFISPDAETPRRGRKPRLKEKTPEENTNHD